MNDSRIDIYNYIYGLLFGVVTDNVYQMNEPQELTEEDTTDGFIVIRIDDIHDESEFHGDTYGWVRVYVEAYVPPISRGRLDRAKYKTFEDGITEAINNEIDNGTNEHFAIEANDILSMDSNADTNANNAYFMYVKSFIVTIQ